MLHLCLTGFYLREPVKKELVTRPATLPDGVADQDGRLRPNDYILQINQHWLQGVGSERVAVVLRGTGNEVRLVVARPVDPNDPAQHRPSLPILPSAIINNRQELEMHLNMGVIPDGIPSSQLANDMVLNPGTENVSIQRGGQAVAEEMSTRFDQV